VYSQILPTAGNIADVSLNGRRGWNIWDSVATEEAKSVSAETIDQNVRISESRRYDPTERIRS
jgi:hypothetical protein